MTRDFDTVRTDLVALSCIIRPPGRASDAGMTELAALAANQAKE